MVFQKQYYWILILVLDSILLDAQPKEDVNKEGEEHRVVFQTLYPEELATGRLLCYGECRAGQEQQKDSIKKPVYTYDPICLGRLILISCKNSPGKRIKINSAFVGRHTSEGNTCLESLQCSSNITGDFQKICDYKENCDYEFGKKFLNDQCGRVKDLAFDIRYQCVNTTNRLKEAPTTPTITEMATTQPPQMTTDEPYSPSPILILRTFETPQTRPSPTPYSKGMNDGGKRREGTFFWLITVYAWMTDERFIREHKAHMALAIILSIFVGLVVSLFFILDHSRRSKANKAKKRRSQRDKESTKHEQEDSLGDEQDGLIPNDDNIPMVTMNNKYPNGCLKKPKMAADHADALSLIVDLPPKYQEEDDVIIGECQVLIENKQKRFANGDSPNIGRYLLKNENDKKLNSDLYDDEEDSDTEKEDFFEETWNGGKNLNNGLQVGVMSDRKISHVMDDSTLNRLPPPPRELLENNSPPPSMSPVNKFIPPPWEFQELEHSLPSLVVTSPDTANTGSIASKTDSGFETPKKVARPCLKNPRHQNSPNLVHEKRVRYPSKIDVINGDLQTIEKSNLKRSESTCSDRVLFSEKRVMNDNNDFIYASQQMDMVNHRSKSMVLPSKSSRYNKSKRNESPLFQTRATPNSADKLVMKPILNKSVLNRNQRKGNLHVIATSKDYQHLHNYDECDDFQLRDDYISKQRFLEIDGDSITQQETEETFIESARSDDNSVLINEHSEQEQPVSIEESGYQSRESDSFCSSNRSTDCEDCHIFKTNHGRCKNSARLQRERSFNKREPTLSNVKVLTKVARRMRYENTRSAQLDNELRPSESSMEDTSSRDSVNIPRSRIKTKRRDGPVFENNMTKRLIENNRKNPAYYSDPDGPVLGNSVAKRLIENNRKNPAYYSDPDTTKRIKMLRNKEISTQSSC